MPKRDPLYSTSAWRKLRKRILDRDGWECQVRIPGVCVGYATQVDHIVPRSVDPGLAMVPENLRASCAPCNLHLGGKLGGAAGGRAARRSSSRHRRVTDAGYGAW